MVRSGLLFLGLLLFAGCGDDKSGGTSGAGSGGAGAGASAGTGGSAGGMGGSGGSAGSAGSAGVTDCAMATGACFVATVDGVAGDFSMGVGVDSSNGLHDAINGRGALGALRVAIKMGKLDCTGGAMTLTTSGGAPLQYTSSVGGGSCTIAVTGSDPLAGTFSGTLANVGSAPPAVITKGSFRVPRTGTGGAGGAGAGGAGAGGAGAGGAGGAGAGGSGVTSRISLRGTGFDSLNGKSVAVGVVAGNMTTRLQKMSVTIAAGEFRATFTVAAMTPYYLVYSIDDNGNGMCDAALPAEAAYGVEAASPAMGSTRNLGVQPDRLGTPTPTACALLNGP